MDKKEFFEIANTLSIEVFELMYKNNTTIMLNDGLIVGICHSNGEVITCD